MIITIYNTIFDVTMKFNILNLVVSRFLSTFVRQASNDEKTPKNTNFNKKSSKNGLKTTVCSKNQLKIMNVQKWVT